MVNLLRRRVVNLVRPEVVSLHRREVVNLSGFSSLTISQNIKDSVLSSSRQLEKQFHSGQIEELLIDLDEGHRYILRGNYKIIYKIYNHKIYITDVFDTRQNPEKIKKRNK